MGLFDKIRRFFNSGFDGLDGIQDVLKDKRRELQREVDSMAKEANKRLDDLKQNELTKAPSYVKWVEGGKIRFGVKGKTYQEVQSEFWRVKNFLDSKTSTVEGAKDVLSKISSLVGVSTEMTAEETSRYFELAEKIKEYYKNSQESAKALDYQAIWEVINKAVERGDVTLHENEYTVEDIEDMLYSIGEIDNAVDSIIGVKRGVLNIFDKIKSGISGFIGRLFR